MNKIRVFTPPYDYDNGKNIGCDVVPLRVFFGGTIDDGKSINWQNELIGELIGAECALYMYVNKINKNLDK